MRQLPTTSFNDAAAPTRSPGTVLARARAVFNIEGRSGRLRGKRARTSTGRLVLVLCLVGALLGALMFTRTASAEAPMASIQASLTNDWINGDGFAPDTGLTVTVDGEVTPNQPSTDGSGHFDYQDAGVDLVPGSVIVVGDGVTSKSLTMVAMSFDSFVMSNPGGPLGTLAVAGTAPVGTVGIGVGNESGGCGTEVSTDGAGNWSATFNADGPANEPNSCLGFVVQSDMGAGASVADGDGDQTVVEPTPPPSIQASLTNDWINGDGFAPDTGLTVTVDGEVTPNQPSTDGSGHFDYQDAGVDLVPGSVIVVGDGVTSKSLTMVAMSFDSFVMSNPGGPLGTLAVAGTAPVGTVQVDTGNESGGCGTEVSTDGAGNWSVLFQADGPSHDPGACPGFVVQQSMGAQASVPDVDNDRTVVEPLPPASIQASLTNNWVQGQSLAPGASVQIWIDVPMSGAPTATTMTDGDGNFFVDPGQLGELDLVPGTVVIVSDGVAPRELVLEGPLTIEIDAVNATASGVLPPGRDAQVEIGGPDCGAGVAITDDGQGDLNGAAGQWAVDLSGQCPGGLGAFDTGGQIFLFDVDGDATIAEPLPPASIQASLTNNWVQGQSLAPGASVQIWIDVPMSGAPTAITTTDGNGNFFAETPMLGEIDLVPGMTVLVFDGVSTRELVLEGPLSIDVDPVRATASGVLPPGRAARVDMGGPDCGASTSIVDNGWADLNGVLGRWAVDVSNQCPDGFGTVDTGGQLWLFDGDGDATIVEGEGRIRSQLYWTSEAPVEPEPPAEETEPAVLDSSQTAPATAVPAPAIAVPEASSNTLAHTGTDPRLFGVALTLVAGGAMLVAFENRHRRHL